MSEVKSLTREELVALAGVVDAERERIKQLIVDNPANTADNQTRRAYIVTLDFLTKRLMESIGEPTST